MGIEEKLPSGVLLTTRREARRLRAQELAVAGHVRPGLLRDRDDGHRRRPRYDLARFGMEVFRASPRQADLMIVAGRVSQKMAPVLRQIYDQMPEPQVGARRWASAPRRGGMFNNYAIVQGVDHVVPVDIYLPGCPPRPEMLMDAILKLHEQIQHDQARRATAEREVARARGRRARPPPPTLADEGPAAVSRRPASSRRRADERSCPPARRSSSPRPRSSSVRHGMFGVARHRRHLRLRRPGPRRSRCPAPARGRTAATSTRSPTRSSAALPGLRRRGREGRRRPRRADLPRAAASTSSSCLQALRDDPALRFELCLGRQRRALPRRRPAASCTPSTPAVDHPQPAGPRRGRRAPTPTRTSRRSSSVYPTDDWHERETCDFFGIVFDGHPALTRIQMPDDWPGHPQRKDYPLGGIPVEYKGAEIPPPDERRAYH